MKTKFTPQAFATASLLINDCPISQLIELLRVAEQRIASELGCCTGIENDRCALEKQNLTCEEN